MPGSCELGFFCWIAFPVVIEVSLWNIAPSIGSHHAPQNHKRYWDHCVIAAEDEIYFDVVGKGVEIQRGTISYESLFFSVSFIPLSPSLPFLLTQ
jgi:hypothetical protein